MIIEAQGLWEQSVYQSDTQLVVDVRPVKEDPNKLAKAPRATAAKNCRFDFQNVEVRAALQAIADISGLNIITSDSVAGNLTLRLKDVPWDQALDVILQAKGLDMRKNGTVLWIAPKEELLTKEKLELEQRAQIAELEPLKLGNLPAELPESRILPHRVRPGRGAGGATGNDRNRVLSKRGSAIIDPRTNQLFVTDIASKLEDIRKLIQKTDVASKQVLIEARLVEANDGFSRNLGAKLGFADMRTCAAATPATASAATNASPSAATWPASARSPARCPDKGDSYQQHHDGQPAGGGIGGISPVAGVLACSRRPANRFLNLELSALEADGKGKIISSPRVVTEDKQVAVIEQGIELPYQIATSSGATAIEFKKANLRLEVTPQITPDGNVVLEVDVSKDSKGEETRAGFAINTQHVKTKVWSKTAARWCWAGSTSRPSATT